MRTFLLLLVLVICFAAYMRAEQPATWNSWMATLGTDSLAVSSANPADSAAPAQHAPARIVPVGGLIKDGTFVAEGRYWEGDGTTDPSGKGLNVRLNPSSWTRVYQTFSEDQGTRYSIEVTYRLSPGLTLSPNPADYTNISEHLQIPGFERFDSMRISPGNFYGTVGDPSSNLIAMEVFLPRLGSTDVQDYQHDYPAIPAFGNKTFALAFPPGTGTITLLTAYVTSR
jgi:hypothetical protein